MRRTTAYEPPASQLNFVPDVSDGTKIRLSKSASEGFGLRVPSSWPIRLRAVIGFPVAPGERLKPFICQRTRTASPAAFWIARSAWKATSASFAPICTHRSPLDRLASNWSEEKAGSGSSSGGRCATSAARSKKVRPKPNVTVSEEGPASSATPVSPSPAALPAISSLASADQRRISAAASCGPRPAPGRRRSDGRTPAGAW